MTLFEKLDREVKLLLAAGKQLELNFSKSAEAKPSTPTLDTFYGSGFWDKVVAVPPVYYSSSASNIYWNWSYKLDNN